MRNGTAAPNDDLVRVGFVTLQRNAVQCIAIRCINALDCSALHCIALQRDKSNPDQIQFFFFAKKNRSCGRKWGAESDSGHFLKFNR